LFKFWNTVIVYFSDLNSWSSRSEYGLTLWESVNNFVGTCIVLHKKSTWNISSITIINMVLQNRITALP
jgi:hypothetical protein